MTSGTGQRDRSSGILGSCKRQTNRCLISQSLGGGGGVIIGIDTGAPEDLAERFAQAPAVKAATRTDGQIEVEAIRLVLDGVARDLSLQTQLISGLSQMGAMMFDAPEDVQVFTAERIKVQVESQFERSKTAPLVAVVTKLPDQIFRGREEFDPSSLSVAGIAVLFVFLNAQAAASSIFDGKREGTFRRLLVAPMPRASILSGKMLAYLLVIFLQVIILFTVGYALFQMPLGESPVALVLLTLVLGLAATSMGMLLGSLCRTSQQADRIGMVAGFVLLALGGTIFPLFRAEGFMGTLSRLTPSSWAIEGHMGLIADNWTLAQTLPNILAVFGFAVVFFAIAVWRFKFE